MKKQTNKETEESSSTEGKKSRGRKKSETPKGLGLFDHLKHIRSVQDPSYFDNLTEIDLKSFNHFMILRGLSMNPNILDEIATVYRYFDKIPSRQFYQLLIGIISPDRNYYPWVKAKKKQFSSGLLELIAKRYEISQKEAEDYAIVLSTTTNGKRELSEICRDFGLTDKEVEKLLMENNPNDD